MIIISHRGNLEGVCPEKENTLEYIQEAIDSGYDVEVDLRVKDGGLYLGHDTPDHAVTSQWLEERSENLWIHVKDYKALVWITSQDHKFMYFCHESDTYCLTSNGYIWSHDIENDMSELCIVPLLDLRSVEGFSQTNFHAVCSDFAHKCHDKFNLE